MFALLLKHFHQNNQLGFEKMVQLCVINNGRRDQPNFQQDKDKDNDKEDKGKFGLDSVVNRRIPIQLGQ